jgi:hypothetical protein
VPTQNNTGSTLSTTDATETVTLAAAPGSGSNRYDLIICQPRGNDLDGGANNDFQFQSVTGTAATTPTVPAVPAGALALAQVYVPGGSASVTAGNITDLRLLGLGVTPSMHARYWRSGAWNFPTSVTALGFENKVYDDLSMYANPAGFTVPFAGVWRMRVQATGQILTTPVPNWFQVGIHAPFGTGVAIGACTPALAAVNVTAIAEHTARVAAGALWVPVTIGNTGTAGTPGATATFFTIDYLGA